MCNLVYEAKENTLDSPALSILQMQSPLFSVLFVDICRFYLLIG